MRDELGVAELVAMAASNVVAVPGREPWNYGWCLTDYRNSPNAAIIGPDGPVAIVGDGLLAWEQAAAKLLNEQRIKDRWAAEEFWIVFASTTVAASTASDRAASVERSLKRLRTVGPALTVLLVSNVTWRGAPIAMEDVVIGHVDTTFIDLVDKSAGRRANLALRERQGG